MGWWFLCVFLLAGVCLATASLPTSAGASQHSLSSLNEKDARPPLRYLRSHMRSDSTKIIRSPARIRRSIIQLRGGLSDAETPTSVLVSTSFGSHFLDKKKRLTILKNSTVAELKSQIHQKFPGSPPTELQNLYFTSRYLTDDDEVVSNITALSPIPIFLDMMCGTGVYNRTMSITQAIDAYVATIVQQSFLGDKMREILSSPIRDTDTTSDVNASVVPQRTMDAVLYRRMYESVKESVYEKYLEDIDEALEAEKEPETITMETIGWRQSKKDISPIAAALAKEFDLNGRGMRSFIYYSIVLAIFAVFGTNTAQSRVTLLLSIPVLWVSKLRQLRLISKIVLYLVLPVLPTLDFLLPLLPATLQTIAHESRHWGKAWNEIDEIKMAPVGSKSSNSVRRGNGSGGNGAEVDETEEEAKEELSGSEESEEEEEEDEDEDEDDDSEDDDSDDDDD